MIRRLTFALLLALGISPAFAQVPAPVPALPDAERRTAYSISASTCNCNINFAIFGDGQDYTSWIEVFVNGTLIPASGNWSIASPSGPIANLARPITDAVLTFTTARTGTVQIVGARRPRRASQFPENRGVPARDFNVVITDLVAQNRENWDKTNDVTGRAILAPPGETLGLLAAANARANTALGFDALGNVTLYSPASAVTSAANVNFLNTGTAAVSRTVQDRLRETVNLADYGVATCDGNTDIAPTLQRAITEADRRGGATVLMPEGVCSLYSTPYLNKYATSGLTVPGLSIRGKGRGVTTLDTRVANGFAIAVNPDWKAAHKSLFGITPATGGSGALATNTYYVQITVNAPSPGGEVVVTLAKSIAVTGPTGRIAITLAPLNSGYSYNLYCGTTSSPANYCIIGGGNASAIGGNQSVNIDAIGSPQVIPSNNHAIWQETRIEDLSITDLTGAANASGVSFFKVGYSNLTNVFMTGLTGTGFELTNYTGDLDGSFMVRIANSKFDHIAGNCVDAGGNTLEMSNFTVDDRTIFNICGTLPTNYVQPQNYGTSGFTISSITNSATPVVTTSVAHTLQTNDQIYIRGVTGMTLADGWYRATVLSGTTYNLKNLNGQFVDTTALGSYTASSGRSMLAWRPPTTSNGVTGCMVWMGLIGTFRNIDFTQCNNFSMYFTELGASDNATLENIDFENTYGKALYAASLSGGSLTNSECLTAVAFGPTISCVQMGTGFNAGGVLNFQIRNMKVRSDVAPMTAFEQFQNTNLPTSFSDTNDVSGLTWQAFDAAGQSRFNGITFDPIPGQVKFSVSATNTFKLAPSGYGCIVPIHLKATGEWIPVCVPDAGITQAVTTSTPSTTYNIYVSNNAATAAPYALSMSASATGTAINQGYSTLSGDSTRTFIGTATTDGSGNFQAAGVQTSFYPPAGAATSCSVSSCLTGLGASVASALAVNVNAVGSIVLNGGNLGTPASGTLTNAIGLPISTGVSGLGTSVASALAVNVNTAGSMLINGGNLGTPATATLTNATGCPIGTCVSGLGASVATALAINVNSVGSVVLNGGNLGSPATVGTMPAFTMGGTITGAANQINGATIVGVSTASGTLELRATSGVGVGGEQIAFTIGNNGATTAGIIRAPAAFTGLPATLATMKIGGLTFGTWPSSTSFQSIGLATLDQTVNTNYNMLFSSGGSMYLNGLSGQALHFRNNDVESATIGAVAASTSSTTGTLTVVGGLGASGAIWAGSLVGTSLTTVASIGTTCTAGQKGARWFVTDNNTALSFAAVITSGGAIQTPVYCDGTVWRQGANDNLPAHMIRKFA